MIFKKIIIADANVVAHRVFVDKVELKSLARHHATLHGALARSVMQRVIFIHFHTVHTEEST
jgi:hypothetical protein